VDVAKLWHSPETPVLLLAFMKACCIRWVLLVALLVGCGERQAPETKRTAKVDFQPNDASATNGQRGTLPAPTLDEVFKPEVAATSNGQRETLPEPAKSKVKTELELLQDRAERGDGEAQRQLGVRLFDGDGVEKDRAEAMAWLRKSADSGNVKAQFNLATVYYSKGLLEKPDKLEASKWFQKAADQGHEEAQLRLAVMYHIGDGVGKSIEKAIKLYRKAADQDNAAAQFLLGQIYLSGDGVAEDFGKGINLLMKAVAQDFEPAKVALISWSSSGGTVKATTPEVLKGLPGVFVMAALPPEAERAGLSTNRIQTSVELRLRSLGIRVFTSPKTSEL
jgi:tetratricopeptide (TPR) repeat protein